MTPLELVRLPNLMERGSGLPEIKVSLIDGPVNLDHPDLLNASIVQVPGKPNPACRITDSVACTHGTFVAGVLGARRGAQAPAICPGCTLLLRPIFAEVSSADDQMPSATADELAQAISDSVALGARVLNVSAALAQPSHRGERSLEQAITYAGQRGALVVAAAGNQGAIGSSVITRHPWVIPVSACDLRGRPMSDSNFGSSIGRHGLSAPGESVTSLGTNGKPRTSGGTSAAAPFVTGAIALLWSEFPNARPADVKFAVTQSHRRSTIVPPVLDAWSAYRWLAAAYQRN